MRSREWPGLKTVAIPRMSAREVPAVAQYFEAGPRHPCILTDAIADWPAMGKWTFEFFSARYRNAMGLVRLGFDSVPGKMTKLGAFIDHLDEPFSAVPGFWIGPNGKPVAELPEFDEEAPWSFSLDPFNKHAELLADVSPFPPAVPNMAAALPQDVANVLSLLGKNLYAIYFSRKGTVTHLHFDFHHTIGCLVQFRGDKKFILFEPGAYRSQDGPGFDPETPDFDLHPQMRDSMAHAGLLQPGEMIIIPPDWWHYARSEHHTITLSHNFFNERNFAAYMRCVLETLARSEGRHELFEAMRGFLRSAS